MPVALPAWPDALRSRTLRIWSGGVLGLFVLGHFTTLALGLASVRAMDALSAVLAPAWASPAGTALLGGALLVHFALTLRALHRRRTLHMSPREAAQLALGVALPFLIVPHVVGARIVPALTGVPMTYGAQLRQFWVTDPGAGARQAIALLVAWGHGCFGFWFALRARPWFARWTWLIYPVAVLVPVLALLGFEEAGRAVAARAILAARQGPALDPVLAPTLRLALYAGLAAPLAGVLVLRSARRFLERGRRVRVTYPDGRSVAVPLGSTVLEASRIGRHPHAALCGGRGRCSTCRVRILEGRESLPQPSALEQATLLRSGASPDHRLACQLRPAADVSVLPVFAPPRARGGAGGARLLAAASHERELAVLFCDLRGFTRRAERWLPFDTVFLLNRYFELVGEAVEDAGGYLDKFIGDGALALFGLGGPPDEACRQALAAAAGVARAFDALNDEFAAELDEPLRVAMGLHAGPAVVGDMGYGGARTLTAVGDGINVASRLEAEAKDRDVEAVVSADLLRRAGRPVAQASLCAIAVRGRRAPVEALLVTHAALLAESATPPKPGPAGLVTARIPGPP